MFSKVNAKLISRRVPGILYVDLDPQRGGKESHDALRDPIDSQGTAGQRILNQADHRAGYCSGDRIAPAYGEIDGDQQRQVENVEPGDETGDQGLQKDRQQRDQHHHEQGIALHIQFTTRC